MFYVLIVYENGTVQTVETADLKQAEMTVEAARGAAGATFVQWGAWPFGPAFGTEIVERAADAASAPDASEPDLFAELERAGFVVVRIG